MRDAHFCAFSLRSKTKMAGFSLLEMIIAVAIFSLVMIVLVSTFVSMVSVRKKTREIQQNMENARVAMNSVAKALRNSDIIVPALDGNASIIRTYNYSQERCEQYEFNDNDLVYSFETVLVVNKADCDPTLPLNDGNFNMLSDTVSSGKFNVVLSTDSAVGRVVILIKIQKSGGVSEALMQSAVSLRSQSQEVNPS